ncbi:MAG: hypothetical protein JNM62_14220 [Flavobacteriales bacterium]|nr:hypothetical protein [Flavobacteriales bacterium]
MDKRIRYGTKEELNAQRERSFLALAPLERLLWFLASFDRRHATDPSAVEKKGNFILQKRRDGVR